MDSKHKQIDLKKQLIYLFKEIYKADKYLIFQIILTSIITAISESLFITFTSLILSDQINNINESNFNQNIVSYKGFILIILAVAITIVRLIYLQKLTHARRQTSIILSRKLINSYLYNNYQSWSIKSFDEFTNLIILQLRMVSKAFGGFFNIISNIVVTFLILLTGLIETPILTTLSFIIIPLIYILLAKRFKPLLNKLSFDMNNAELNKIEIIKDSYFLKESIIADNDENHYLNNFNYEEKMYRNFEYKYTFIDASPKIILEGVCFSLIGMIFLIQLISSYKVNIQELIIFALVLQRSIPLIQTLFSQWGSFQTNIKQIDDVYLFLKNFKKPNYSSVKSNIEKQIEFKNIYFKEVIKDVNFKIKPGDKIALIGESGSGKTTLAMMIAGIIKHTAGTIYIDNKKLTNSNAKEYIKYLSSTSFCSYKPYITVGNLLKNITLRNNLNNIEEKKVINIAKALGIFKYWNKKDLSNMSGGEKQRVAIARVLYKKSKLVILDEITSSLDIERSGEVLKYLFNELKDSTIILITHKPNETKLCNKTFKLNHGNLE